LKKRGFVISLVGVEAMRQSSLESVNKGTSVNKLIETINELHENHVYVHTTYMIGYENDTEEQIREDIKALKKVPFDSNQTCILTPFPATKLYDRFIKKYKVKLDEPGNFDAYNLVWSHKNFTPESMDRLWRWAWKQLYSPYRLARSLYKLFRSGAIPHSWKPAVKEKNLPERTYPLVTETTHPATPQLSQTQVPDVVVEAPRNGNGKKPVGTTKSTVV